MSAYLCLNCHCLHGWSQHPAVFPVTRHERWPAEDIWWCPRCTTQHRSFDGSWWGQQYKRWREIPNVDQFLHEQELEHLFHQQGFPVRYSLWE